MSLSSPLKVPPSTTTSAGTEDQKTDSLALTGSCRPGHMATHLPELRLHHVEILAVRRRGWVDPVHMQSAFLSLLEGIQRS